MNLRLLFSRSIWILILILWVNFVACNELPSRPSGPPGGAEENPRMFSIKAQSDTATTGSVFATSIKALNLEQRETRIFEQVSLGNIPQFLRTVKPVQFTGTIHDSAYEVIFYVMPDYLSVGTDDNYFLMPMTPILAQKVMDRIGGIFPTRKMVNLIWAAAEVKLQPEPIAPSPAMVTIPVFDQHNSMVQSSRNALLSEYPLGATVSGHKKDVILSNRISDNLDKVVIYGWHYTSGIPIQPLYSGHVIWYADYSHGIRAVLTKCQVNGQIMKISDILSDPVLYTLLSDESGPMESTRYDTSVSSYQ